MTVAQAKTRTYTLYSGENTDPDQDESALMLRLFNIFKDRWAREPGVDWNSQRSIVSIGTVTATDTFPLTGVSKISKQEGDHIVITRPGGGKTYYNLVPSTTLTSTDVDNPVAVVGNSLYFPNAFTATSPEFGGTIKVPQYSVPADMTADGDTVPIDDPDWLCYMAAAELSRQDVTKTDQYPTLIAYASESMAAMKENNEAQVDDVYTGESIFVWNNDL